MLQVLYEAVRIDIRTVKGILFMDGVLRSYDDLCFNFPCITFP